MADGRADLESAIRRLDRALASLEGGVRGLKAKAFAPDDDLFAPASAATGPSAREQALERAAAEASEALDHAAAEIRAVLEEA